MLYIHGYSRLYDSVSCTTSRLNSIKQLKLYIQIKEVLVVAIMKDSVTINYCTCTVRYLVLHIICIIYHDYCACGVYYRSLYLIYNIILLYGLNTLQEPGDKTMYK